MSIRICLAGLIFLFSNTVFGAWESGSDSLDSSPGELILTIWNYQTGASFSQDLGASTIDFLLGASAERTFNLDQDGMDHVLANSDRSRLRWNVAGANRNSLVSGSPRIDHYGFYITATSEPVGGYSHAAHAAGFGFFSNYSAHLSFAGSTVYGTANEPVYLNRGSEPFWGETMGGFTNSNWVSVESTSANEMDSIAAYTLGFDNTASDTVAFPAITKDINLWSLDIDQSLLLYGVPVPISGSGYYFFATLLLMGRFFYKKRCS